MFHNRNLNRTKNSTRKQNIYCCVYNLLFSLWLVLCSFILHIPERQKAIETVFGTCTIMPGPRSTDTFKTLFIVRYAKDKYRKVPNSQVYKSVIDRVIDRQRVHEQLFHITLSEFGCFFIMIIILKRSMKI